MLIYCLALAVGKERMGVNAMDLVQLLQFHIATYKHNDIAGQPQALQKSGRPVKSIRARFSFGIGCQTQTSYQARKVAFKGSRSGV